jgi:hypothetical protein
MTSIKLPESLLLKLNKMKAHPRQPTWEVIAKLTEAKAK